MSRVVGSVRKATFNGVTYLVKASTNVKRMGSKFTNEAIATSGENVRKMTKRVDSAESLDLVVTGLEAETLKDLSESTSDIPMSLEYASGDVYRTVGWVHLDSHESEEGTASVTIFPRRNWEAFVNA